MLRVSNKENAPEKIQGAYVYHPQSAALEKRVQEMLDLKLAMFGLSAEDYHEIRNDLDFVRQLRRARARTVAIAAKSALLAGLALVGSLLSAGFYALIERGQP